MNVKAWTSHLLFAAAATVGTINCAGDTPSIEDDANVETPSVVESEATLVGLVLDWADVPVTGADVVLSINGQHVGDAVQVDAEGFFRLPVDVDAIQAGYRMNQEVNVLVYSPFADLEPLGTFEGDRIHLLPITLEEFIDVDELQADAFVQLRTAYVPLQAPGYALTDELVENGGELTWQAPNPNGGAPLDVTMIIEPNSIVLDADDPQQELNLTFLDAERAPMQIPNDGFGVLWTLQPRDVRFDPPARIRLEGERAGLIGLTELEEGDDYPIFGASLDRGWEYYGDSQVAAINAETVVLESPEGIIHRGAWGHVLSNPESDAGMLVTCRNELTGNYVVCAIIGQRAIEDSNLDDLGFWTNVSRSQADYNDEFDRLFWYTDKELRCSGCTNVGNAQAQMATGLTLGLPEDDDDPIFVIVTELCQSEVEQRIDPRDQVLFDRLDEMALVFTDQVDVVDPGAGAGDTPRSILWDAFCSDSVGPEAACPPFSPADIDVGRRQFTRQYEFMTSNAHCAEDDRQPGAPANH